MTGNGRRRGGEHSLDEAYVRYHLDGLQRTQLKKKRELAEEYTSVQDMKENLMRLQLVSPPNQEIKDASTMRWWIISALLCLLVWGLFLGMNS